jgi:hypothetical protein
MHTDNALGSIRVHPWLTLLPQPASVLFSQAFRRNAQDRVYFVALGRRAPRTSLSLAVSGADSKPGRLDDDYSGAAAGGTTWYMIPFFTSKS